MLKSSTDAGSPVSSFEAEGDKNLQRATWPALDGLRGISIILVVAVHLWAHASSEGDGLPVTLSMGKTAIDLTWIFATGSNGVSIFFVLSGFLLYRHWLEHDRGQKLSLISNQFYRRRFRRIFPAFCFFSIVYLLLAAIIGTYHLAAALTVPNILLNIGFVSPIAVWFGSRWAESLDIVPGTWSLNPEIWFYAALPFLAGLLRRFPARWLIILALSFVAPLFRWAIMPGAVFVSRYAFPGVLDAFLFGMAVADLSMCGAIRQSAGLLFPLGAIWYICCSASLSPLKLDWATQIPAASALMIAGLIAPGDWPWKRWLSAPSITYIGHISYSVFLSNVAITWYFLVPLAHVSGLESPSGHFLVNILIGFPVLYLVGATSFEYIEKPFMSRTAAGRYSMVGRATKIGAALCGVSLLLASVVNVQSDDVSDYHGPGAALLSKALRSVSARGLPKHIRLAGDARATSETGRSSVNIVQIKTDTIQIALDRIDAEDRWIAITLPADYNSVVRGYTISMSANLTINTPSDIKGCLGIFNGINDVCSPLRAMRNNDRLTISTRVANSGQLQFKFNVFPDGASVKSVLILSDITISEFP